MGELEKRMKDLRGKTDYRLPKKKLCNVCL